MQNNVVIQVKAISEYQKTIPFNFILVQWRPISFFLLSNMSKTQNKPFFKIPVPSLIVTETIEIVGWSFDWQTEPWPSLDRPRLSRIMIIDLESMWPAILNCHIDQPFVISPADWGLWLTTKASSCFWFELSEETNSGIIINLIWNELVVGK